MTVFEYKVIPAPSKGRKAAGIKGAEARFAHTLEAEINALAAEGWAYLRSDILPSEERQGLTSSHTVYRSVLVFQRALSPDAPAEDRTQSATAAREADTEPDPEPDTEPHPDPDTQPDTVEIDAATDDMANKDTSPDGRDLPR